METNTQQKEAQQSQQPKRTQISEIGKVALLKRLFEGTQYNNTAVQMFQGRIPDKAGRTRDVNNFLTVQKTMLEGIDFDLTYTPLKHLGYKAALLALGGIYAKCFNPCSLAFSLGLSARFCVEDIAEFWGGVLGACKEHNIEQLSLDLGASMTGLNIAVTACGMQSTKTLATVPTVDNTCLLCLTGNVGAAYMGLHVLEREKIAFNKIPAERAAEYVQPDLSKYKYILSQYLSPEINPKTTDQFKEAKLFPACGYFITNGLAAAVKQLCDEHNVGAKIYLGKIPIASQTFAMAEELNMDAITAALNGGDDYKFLFAVPVQEHERFHKEFPNVDIIGHLCKPEAGAMLVTPEGAEITLRAQGY